MPNSSFDHTLTLKVRDYECDLQGIVNNSVYQNYLEHARHEYLLNQNISFSQLASTGINLVVVRAEVDYKSPLKSGDSFWVGTRALPSSRLKGIFEQEIYRKTDDNDDTLAIKALITWAAITPQGKPLPITPYLKQLQPN